jgi:Undecaprenyl-phosphate galactose phosphotransferase WbaP
MDTIFNPNTVIPSYAKPGSLFRKESLSRMMDLLIVTVTLPFVAPVMLLIAAMIMLDSRGNALFRHTRIGKNGRKFQMLKFRTMMTNGEEVLQKHLESCPESKAEWEATQKLKDDPRLTRVGKLLRKSSMDELPQLINIYKGEMSLVGPRPIYADEEIRKFGDRFQYYKQVRPGLTGLWQVSGRTNTSYETRVQLDEYYVRNWSFWLDIRILFRTFRVVLRGEGAY